MTKDPVCGMALDEKMAVATASYKGQAHHFCSGACKDKFEKDPNKYAHGTSQGPAGGQKR